MTPADLSGLRVIVPVTRAHRGLAARVAERGADVDEVPFIAIDPPSDPGPLEAAARAVADGAYAWLAVTSRNGIAALAQTARLEAVDLAAGGARVAAVGHATAHECRALGMAPELVATGAGAQGLVDAFPAAPPSGGRRVLAPLGNLADDTLAHGLGRKGWDVDPVEAYRTVDGAGASAETLAALAAGAVDAALVTSASVAVRLAKVWPTGADGTMVVAIGATTARAAAEAGLVVAAVATEPTRDAMVAALQKAMKGRGSGHD